MSKALKYDSFRYWYKKAVRVEEDNDWSVHSIDYATFKQRLTFFARRRSRLRAMIDESKDKRISVDVLNTMLNISHNPKTSFYNNNNNNTQQQQEQNNVQRLQQQEEQLLDVPSVISTMKSSKKNNSPLRNSASHDIDDDDNEPTSDYIAYIDPDQVADSDLDSQLSKPGLAKRKNKRTVMRRLSIVERKEMAYFLTWEIDKVQMFYLAQWQRLSTQLENNINSTADIFLGDEILELLAFCVINIITAKQILIRYDAYARTFGGMPMLTYYMKHSVKHATSFRKVLFHEELRGIADTHSQLLEASGDAVKLHFDAQRSMFQDLLQSASAAEALASTGKADLSDSVISSFRNWFHLATFEDRLGLEPAYLTMRGQSLTSEMKQLSEWRKKKHEIMPPKNREKQLSDMQIFHLTLNLLSAFLYCMNYYIVEPSSTMYVSHLGAHDAMSGTLIGMMPLAAFISSLPFSMWTNNSFRQPFIMSCCLLICGNLLYSIADCYRMVQLALAGRFIAGLGAPKCIIRRFLADTTPLSLRTTVNAGFGMVVAAGSAMGPAMAIMLNKLEGDFAVPRFNQHVYLNGLTLPGYFMACLWFTFLLIVLLTFEEPDRAGLEEQKAKEAAPPTEGLLSEIINKDDQTVVSATSSHDNSYSSEFNSVYDGSVESEEPTWMPAWVQNVVKVTRMITFPVRICLALLFAKVFTIETLVSATSAISKNRYHWQVQQVGTLGFLNGMLVIPFSIMIGRLSMTYQDHVLMRWLVCAGCFGMFLLIDLSDLVATPTGDYNYQHILAVGPKRYMCGYFLCYLCIQSFEGVIGSTLSKVIPTALASGTVNSGLLATLVDTFGRACGDMFISLVGFINLRQLLNLLFIPGFVIMLTCLIIIEKFHDLLAV